MVGVAVTEPDTGSDVAALRCRATPAVQDGVAGWLIDGAKAWSTFAGRADVLALLARSDRIRLPATAGCRCSSSRSSAAWGTRST